MYDLLLTVRVRPEKRAEFVLSARALMEAAPGVRGSPSITASLEDANLLSCRIEWETEAALREFLRSDAFRALRGAVRTLTEQGGLQVLQEIGPAEDWH